jgi:hypothetical protein
MRVRLGNSRARRMFLKALAIYNAARSHVIAVQLARSGSGERVNNQQRENCPDRGGNVSGRQVPVSPVFKVPESWVVPTTIPLDGRMPQAGSLKTARRRNLGRVLIKSRLLGNR